MPTKPTATFTHATNANYDTGPANTFPTKFPVPDIDNGFIPGSGISAEQANSLFNTLGQWVTDWLDQGSSAAGVDAHLMETDANGRNATAAFLVGGTASSQAAFQCSENTGSPALTANIINTTATGTALSVSNSVGSSGPALAVNNAGSTGTGMTVTSAGSTAILAQGGPTDPAVSCLAGTNGEGLRAQGDGTGDAIVGFAGADGAALTAIGVLTSTEPAAKFAGGLFAGAQVRGTIYLQPTTATPSAPVDGDVWKRPGGASVARGGLEYYDADGASGGGGGGKQRVWSTSAGMGYGYAESDGVSSESAGTPTTKVSLTIDTTVSPGPPAGEYIVEFTCAVRLAAGAALTTEANVSFSDGTWLDTYTMDFNSLTARKSITAFKKLTVAAGANTFTIQFSTSSAGNGVEILDARIVARGAYEI